MTTATGEPKKTPSKTPTLEKRIADAKIFTRLHI